MEKKQSNDASRSRVEAWSGGRGDQDQALIEGVLKLREKIEKQGLRMRGEEKRERSFCSVVIDLKP